MTEEGMTMERNASPQAWRRLRNTMTAGELRDIAADIAQVLEWIEEQGEYASFESDIEYALTGVPWEDYEQA